MFFLKINIHIKYNWCSELQLWLIQNWFIDNKLLLKPYIINKLRSNTI